MDDKILFEERYLENESLFWAEKDNKMSIEEVFRVLIKTLRSSLLKVDTDQSGDI